MSGRIAVLFGGALSLAAQAPVTVQVVLPGPLGEMAAPLLRERLGGEVVAMAVEPTADFVPAAGAVLVGLERQRAHRLAERGLLEPMPGGATFAAAWQLSYVLAFRPREVAAPPGTWEELALAAELHDRLGLLPADVDAVPWLAAMEQCLLDGRGQQGGFALWTTLDARRARRGTGYGEVRAALLHGDLVAAVLPAPLLQDEFASSAVALATGFQGLPRATLGIAVARGAGPDAVSLAHRLATPPLGDELRQHVRLGAADSDASVDAAMSSRWLQHLEQRIAGRGRRAEDIAELIDLVAFLCFAAILFAVWWRQRRARRIEPGAAAPDESES